MTEAILYKTTNKVNGKWYVGVHVQIGAKFDGYLGSGKALKKSIAKHGREDFERKTLCVGGTDYIYSLEEQYLKGKWGRHDNYNMSPGGFGGPGFSGELHPFFGSKHSAEAREKMRLKSLGNDKCLGLIRSDETKKKISASLTGRKRSLEHTANIKEGIRRSKLKLNQSTTIKEEAK